MPPHLGQPVRHPVAVAHVEDGASPVRALASAALRISLGFVFLWAFLDKTFGLGYATPAARAWIRGGSPTRGFLANADGWFSGFFQGLAGNTFVDWMFMIGLLGLGLALILGIGMRIAAASGALMMLLMWAAVMPVTTNPLVDDHIVYAFALVLLAATGAGRDWGLGARWRDTRLVQRYPILE